MKRYTLALIEVSIEGHKMDAPDIFESADGPLCKFSDHTSEVREKDELIQKLADTIADQTGATFMEMTFGLRMVGGKWERCK